MTTRSPCPETSALSELIDQETETGESSLRIHISACERCRRELSRLERAANLLSSATAKEASAQGKRPNSYAASSASRCLSDDELVAWVTESLGKEEAAAAEKHLATCDVCLHEASEAMQMRFFALDSAKSPVPTALAERVASRWKQQTGTSLSEIVIRVAREGLELVRRHLELPISGLEPIPMAAPAFRSGAPVSSRTGEPLRFLLQAKEATIQATVLAEGDSVRLDLVLRDPDATPLAGQRVHLRQRGRSIFSARTDESGALHMPRLEPGVYEIFCAGIETSFRLDLRS